MRLGGYSYVIGRSETKGDFRDVRIKTSPEGFNRIDIARDPRDTNRRITAIERRLLPDGPWSRLLTVKSFDEDSSSNELTETKVKVEFEDFNNLWDIDPEATWGLPESLESPWNTPIEMVGNELLLNTDVEWVSGDAPTNYFKDKIFTNGKYSIQIGSDNLYWYIKSGEYLGGIKTETSDIVYSEGVAGAAFFKGGWVWAEPAKPILFYGDYVLENYAKYVKPGLYRYGGGFAITTEPLNGLRGSGGICLLKDPYPERWIRRMMGRAHSELISPTASPPFFEEDPDRIGISVVKLDTDFPFIEPEVVTPYANETGVFNSWDIKNGDVRLHPSERPWDVYLPMSSRREDWGGLPFHSDEQYRRAVGKFGDEASFPNREGYILEDLPPLPEGSIYFRWKDSNAFVILENEEIRVAYKNGYVYFYNSLSPQSNGIANIEPISEDWNETKVEWTTAGLYINDKPALIEERSWEEATSSSGIKATWAAITNTPFSDREFDPDSPDEERTDIELPPGWSTGRAEPPDNPTPIYYHNTPRTWGRLLYEELDDSYIEIKSNDMTLILSDIENTPTRSLR